MAALRKRIVCRQYMEDHSGLPFTLAYRFWVKWKVAREALGRIVPFLD